MHLTSSAGQEVSRSKFRWVEGGWGRHVYGRVHFFCLCLHSVRFEFVLGREVYGVEDAS